jgi:virginiamycin A acetyltransferase
VRDVEPYTVVCGNPAAEIRKRFSPEIINRLLKLQWWNWDEEKILRNLKHLTGNHLERLTRDD